MFPYAVLIGAMLSLGAMASDMEFISMHSAGISIAKIIIIIMTQAFILSIVFYTISDSFVPKFTSHAEHIKNTALNKKVVFNHNGCINKWNIRMNNSLFSPIKKLKKISKKNIKYLHVKN